MALIHGNNQISTGSTSSAGADINYGGFRLGGDVAPATASKIPAWLDNRLSGAPAASMSGAPAASTTPADMLQKWALPAAAVVVALLIIKRAA